MFTEILHITFLDNVILLNEIYYISKRGLDTSPQCKTQVHSLDRQSLIAVDMDSFAL